MKKPFASKYDINNKNINNKSGPRLKFELDFMKNSSFLKPKSNNGESTCYF